HLTAHALLIVSFDAADAALGVLMAPWRTPPGTAVLFGAFLAHYGNALWSIYVRRSLRLSRWELWQLVLGLSIPVLMLMHVIGTRVAEIMLFTLNSHRSVL